MPDYPPTWKDIDASLCHDWLTGMRGGERVLELLGEGFPDAPIYTLIYNRSAMSEAINRHPVITTWLQKIPGIMKQYRYFLPLFPMAINSLKPGKADLIISTSHCVAKALQPQDQTRHLCYCFTPMRYAWMFHEEYLGRNPFKQMLGKPILSAMRKWDGRTVDRVDHFVAISKHVQQRIRQFYGRDADVVYPPVNTEYFHPSGAPPKGFDLVVSALVPYKRLDLAVQVYKKTGRSMKVAGSGTELEALKSMAGDNIEFLGRVSDEELRTLYQDCRCLVFPGEEDFGIVPLEAMACGRPVIAYARGGATETVVDGESGLFFEAQSEEALLAAVEACAARDWDPAAIRRQAEKFDIPQFIAGMDRAIQKCLEATTAVEPAGKGQA